MHLALALSPLDGRYHSQTEALNDFLSEQALFRYRAQVEIEYLIALTELGLPNLPAINEDTKTWLRSLYHEFSHADFLAIQAIEQEVKHDVKALEYFLAKKFNDSSILSPSEKIALVAFLHFGLTSQDINNTAIPLSLRDALQQVYLPELEVVIAALFELAKSGKELPMLARTHGQPASPTTIGKELYVFVERLQIQFRHLVFSATPCAKFGGATGNFNAHAVIFPTIDWVAFANSLIEDQFGLSRSQTTTQIDHYDSLASLFDAMRRINTILIDLCRDVWAYISMEYIVLATKAGEVGSSTMPHKVNPIDFENAEGNLALANANLQFLSEKLPISRLQRDLTDSTVLRNVSLPFGHGLIAFKNIQKGIAKLSFNEHQLANDLANHYEVLTEAIQTALRAELQPDAYDRIKDASRGKKITPESLKEMIHDLPLSAELKTKLLTLQPANYIGYAARLVPDALNL
jgi:adenylosuccinate lyase